MLENIRKRDKKSVKILSIVTVLSLICCITLIVIAAHKPGSPEFCARCHSMATPYNTWKEKVSCNTGCLGCHTHDNSGRTLSVEIEDNNCTNTDCHPVEKLTSKLSEYKEVFFFNHETHLKKFPTNLKLRCTGCHSRLDKGAENGKKIGHFGIDEKACFVCHFMEGETPMLTNDKKHVDECLLCHKDVQVQVKIYEKEFDHLKYEKELGVECTNCHFDTIHRNNNVEKRNCYYCHSKVSTGYEGADSMHNDHVVKHKVPCSPCHDEISHKWDDEYVNNILLIRGLDARDKHFADVSKNGKGDEQGNVDVLNREESIFEKDAFCLQRKIYAGDGGVGVERSPDPMYLATVNCIACHIEENLNVDPKVCNCCHEKGFDKTMAEQKEYITGMLNLLSRLLIESQERGVSKSMIKEARFNYELIIDDRSFGVHNIKYIKDLINYSMKQLQLASKLQFGSEQ
ncbi:MAG: hypothetical protein GY777_29600 [Candidatus Brocadiaceae bacterium]|nr:hypothetical protein [Candidatus Brocadiaceae bacterium]